MLRVLLFLLVASPSWAESNAEKVFGPWEKVTIEQIAKKVPEYYYQRDSLGSVTNEYKPKNSQGTNCTLAGRYVGGYPCQKADK